VFSLVRLIFGWVTEIPERFADDCHGWRNVEREFSNRANVKRKGHFTDDHAGFVTSRVLNSNVKVAIFSAPPLHLPTPLPTG
jgi:hypothetical protein